MGSRCGTVPGRRCRVRWSSQFRTIFQPPYSGAPRQTSPVRHLAIPNSRYMHTVTKHSWDSQTYHVFRNRQGKKIPSQGDFLDFLIVLYSTLLHLPPLRFHCVGECWDRTQDCCDFGIGIQTL